MRSSLSAAPRVRVPLLALAVVPLLAPCVAGSYTSSATLPQIDEGLASFLSRPFNTIDRATAMTRLSLLDVSATTSAADAELREWLYAQMVAMDVQQGNKGGIDMVYVGFEDGRFIGYFSIEGEGQYTYRGPGTSPASDLEWAPYTLGSVNTETSVRGIDGKQVVASCPAATTAWPADATCTGIDSVDASDCAASATWTGGDKTQATCATANGCVYSFSGCITGSPTACCSENIRNYYDTTRADGGGVGRVRRWRSYDPRVRPWYMEQKAFFDHDFPTGISDRESVGWSSIYAFFTSRLLGITATGAVMLPDGSFGGVWAVDFPLGDMSELLQTAISDRQPGYACWVFVVERSGINAGKLLGSAERSVSGDISTEPMLSDTGERPSAVDSSFPAIAHAAGLLQAAGWTEVTSLAATVNSVRYEVASKVFVDRSIDWLLVGSDDTTCPLTHIWRADRGVCEQCLPGKHPVDDSCVECPQRQAGADGSCHPCAGSQIPNEMRTACEACPTMSVPAADATACVPCASGLVPDADGTTCICAEGRYDKSYGLIFCFDLGWKSDPIRAASPAFSQKARVELASGNLCLPCPDCVQCNSSGAAPVPATGWALSPTAEQIWTAGLNTNTTRYVMDPGLIEKMMLENPAMSTREAERFAEDFRSLHVENVDASEKWRSSFFAYAQDCLSRTAESIASCSETFAGEDELNGYCDYDHSSQTCRPALHRHSLNRSLFKCVDMGGGQSTCNRTAAARRDDTNSSRASYCAPLHTGTLCSVCEQVHNRRFLPDIHGGMDKECKPCVKGGAKFAMTVAVLASLAALMLWLIRYFEKKNAKLDDLRVHYTILAKVQQAVSSLRGDESVNEEDDSKVSLVDTVRVIIGNLQIIATLPVVFEAKFVKHLHFSQWIFDLRKVFQLDFFGLMSIDCLIRTSLYIKFLFTLAIPTILIAIIQARAAAKWFMLKRNARKVAGAGRPASRENTSMFTLARVVSVKKTAAKMKSSLAKRKNVAASLTFAVIFFFYPACNTIIFQMLDCREMDLGQTWHSYDLSINCHSTTYRRVRILAVMLIFLLPIGIPVFFGAILYLNRERLSTDRSADIGFDVFAKICRTLHPNCDEALLKELFEDVDTDESGGLSPHEVHSYAFFNELQRRIAVSRRAAARHSARLLATNTKKLIRMNQLGRLSPQTNEEENDNESKMETVGSQQRQLTATHSNANSQRKTHGLKRTVTAAQIQDIANDDSETRARLFASAIIERQHDSRETIHVDGIPAIVARTSGALADIFAEFGKVASVTIRRRPYKGMHRNWALVTFINIHSAERALDAALSDERIAVHDQNDVTCYLRCAPFDLDCVFRSEGKAKRIWEQQRDALAKGTKKPWWFGDKDDYAFLVRIYRPSMYWFEMFIFTKKLILSGVIVFADPGSMTQLFVATMVSFVSFGVLEHCRPYKSAQTMKFARLAEANLFTTLTFILLMETELAGEFLGYDFYDLALVMMTSGTSAIPILIAISVSLRRIYKLWADSDPTVRKGDSVEVIDLEAGQDAKCLHCVGKVASETPEECTYDTIIAVEVTPRDYVLQSTRSVCRRPEVVLRTCQRWFCCHCGKGRSKIGQLRIGERVRKPVILQLQRSQIRKIVDKKKVMLECCKIGVQTCRFAREVSDDSDKSVPDANEKMAKIHKTDMPEGEISNAAFAGVLANQLKPVLEPLLISRGLLWEPCLPYIKKAFNADELQKALSDPEAAIKLLLENPVIRRMILESLRKVVEPLVVASNLTWLVFRSAFDMITEPAQIEECLKDPHAFFDYMLKKGGVVCKVLIATLQPKLEHLVAEQSMTWVVVVSALEGMATVEMLLIAHETPESWWEKIAPKLAGASHEPDEESAVPRFRPAAMAVVAANANGGSDRSVGDAQSSQQASPLIDEVQQQEAATPNLRRPLTPDLDSADHQARSEVDSFMAELPRSPVPRAEGPNRTEQQNPPPPSGAAPISRSKRVS